VVHLFADPKNWNKEKSHSKSFHLNFLQSWERMENTVELTKNLISSQHDENSVAEDSALKTMLAGMLQLAHAALNVLV
jgi:hypothetical protein